MDSLDDVTANVRRKSLRTALQSVVAPVNVPGDLAIQEEEDWCDDHTVDIAEYKELIRLIEDHVIMPFDHGEWRGVLGEKPLYKETPV